MIVKLPTSRRYVSSSRAKLRSRSPDPSSPRQQRQQGAVAAGKILAVVPWPSLAPHHTCPRVNLRTSGNTPSKYFGGFTILQCCILPILVLREGSPFLKSIFKFFELLQ